MRTKLRPLTYMEPDDSFEVQDRARTPYTVCGNRATSICACENTRISLLRMTARSERPFHVDGPAPTVNRPRDPDTAGHADFNLDLRARRLNSGNVRCYVSLISRMREQDPAHASNK